MRRAEERLETLLGIPDIHIGLERAYRELWVPYWKNLPPERHNPRTLLEDRELVYALIERVGSNLCRTNQELGHQLAVRRFVAKQERATFLKQLAGIAPFALTCEAHSRWPRLDLPTSVASVGPDEIEDDYDEDVFEICPLDDAGTPLESNEEAMELDQEQVTAKDETPLDEETSQATPEGPWELHMTFGRGNRSHTITVSLSHQEFVEHFATIAVRSGS